MKCNNVLRKIAWFLTFLTMAFIFYMSSRSIEESRYDSAWLMSALGIVENKDAALEIQDFTKFFQSRIRP